jgi:hypothetical protein
MLWFLCCGTEKSASSGVAILIDQKRKNKIERYIYVNDRILTTRFQTEKKVMQNLQAADMRFLRSVKVFTNLDKIRNEYIRK